MQEGGFGRWRPGPNSIVGSHVCLTDDLEPDRMAVAESARKTIRNPFKVKQETVQKASEGIRGLICVE